MWCDTYDMDLPKVVPGAIDVIAPVKDLVLYTVGYPWKDGSLNHPSVWHTGMGTAAFFGFRPSPPQPEGYVSDGSTIRCTLEEAVRDCWPHGYVMLVRWQGAGMEWHATPVWNSGELYSEFCDLMGHVRGHARCEPDVIESARRAVLESLRLVEINMNFVDRLRMKEADQG